MEQVGVKAPGKENNITFNVLDWNFKDDIDDDCEDDDIEEDSLFVIECFGRPKDDKSIYVKITRVVVNIVFFKHFFMGFYWFFSGFLVDF